MPALLVLAAVIVAVGLVQVDIVYADVLSGQRWEPLLNAGAEGARGMLAANRRLDDHGRSVAFSVTIVTLSLASTQYTPRILRNFMRDRANQFMLGTFVAIFTLIVMRTIRGGGEENSGGFVPLVAVAFGMLLALLSIGCLIFFIHHIAASIPASTILKKIADETTAAITRVFPQEIGEGEEPSQPAETAEAAGWHSVAADQCGYLLAAAGSDSRRFRHRRDALASSNTALDEEAATALRALFVVGEFRTVGQDVVFGIRQIVDIAMKALSPGVNDASTAVSCLDYLSVLLSNLTNRRLVPSYLLKDDQLRIIASVPSFADFVAKSFDEVRLSAEGNVTIILQMLCALQRVAYATADADHKRTLLEHARLIAASADRSVEARYDRARINSELDALRNALPVGLSPFRRPLPISFRASTMS